MVCGPRFGRAACKRARNRSRFSFGSLRSTYDRTLARLPKLLRYKSKALPSKPTEEKSISLPHFFLMEQDRRRGRRVKPARFLSAPYNRRGKMGWTYACAACPWLPFLADASPCSVPVLIHKRPFTFADAIRTISLVCNKLTSANRSIQTCTLSGVECRKFSWCEAPQVRNGRYGRALGAHAMVCTESERMVLQASQASSP